VNSLSLLAMTVSESADDQVVLVSSAEFVLKSSPVRRTLEQRLIDDLRFALRNSGFHDFTTDKAAGRIIVGRISDAMLSARVIARVFGVASAAPAVRVEGSMEAILNAVLQRAVKTLTADQSFAIRCHRSSQSMISTRGVEREGGSQILSALAGRKIKVNLNQPDILISVDLSGQNAYVYTTRLQGPGGLPLSSQWKMLAVLDSGPQSLFAAYVMMRRGCLTQLLIPCSSTDAYFLSEHQLMLARKLREFVTRENYPGFILELDKMPQASKIIRRISLEFARKHRFRGVIFADVAGAIAVDSSLTRRSQELALPIFQPLIGLDEMDLRKLGQLLDVEWCHSGKVSIESNALVDSLDLANMITEISL
jgi:thiamine biosynthesis protein ThiI